jgi:MFS family permease
LNEGDDFKGKEKTSLEQTEERNKNRTENNLWRQLPKILCTKIFISTSIGNTVAFFGMRVIQFYADKFMELVLDVQKNMKFIYYIVLCLTGPVFGIIICGLICTKIGGYTSKKGMIFIFSLNVIACVSSSFITISLHQYIALPAAWLFLFCFAAATPLQGGIIIASLPKELKGNGYSINMFFLNALGSFPSSYVYALICDAINRDYPEQGNMRYRTTLMITMFYNYAGLILIGIASIFRFRIEGELGSEKKEDQDKNRN